MANLRLKLEKSTSNEYSLDWIEKPTLYSASVLVDNVYLEFERGLLLSDDVVLVKFDKQTTENTYEPLTKEITLMVIDSDTVELTPVPTYTCVYGIIPKNVTSKVGTVKMSFSVKRPYYIGDVVKYKVITTQVVTVQIEDGGSNEGYDGINETAYDNLVKLINEKSLVPGPANKITIGTVTKGEEAAATITGEYPNQKLNLVLPRGENGLPGEKGEKGEPGIAGEKGATGPANQLTIGSVQTGTTASATLSGTAPNQVLSLTLPRGEKGDKGEKGEKGDGTSIKVNGVAQSEITFTTDPQAQIDKLSNNYLRETDLNTIKDKRAQYDCIRCTNSPVSNGLGTLTVSLASGEYVQQIFVTTNGVIYNRCFDPYVEGGKWQRWKRLLTNYDIAQIEKSSKLISFGSAPVKGTITLPTDRSYIFDLIGNNFGVVEVKYKDNDDIEKTITFSRTLIELKIMYNAGNALTIVGLNSDGTYNNTLATGTECKIITNDFYGNYTINGGL